MKLESGQLAATSGVSEWMSEDFDAAVFVNVSLQRHLNGDWGDIDEDDKILNDAAARHGHRVLSQYKSWDKTVLIVTEYDRSVTTVLFPEEY